MTTIIYAGKPRQVIPSGRVGVPGMTHEGPTDDESREAVTVWLEEWGVTKEILVPGVYLTGAQTLQHTDLPDKDQILHTAKDYTDTINWLLDACRSFSLVPPCLTVVYDRFLADLRIGYTGSIKRPCILLASENTYLTLLALADCMEEEGDPGALHIRNYAEFYVPKDPVQRRYSDEAKPTDSAATINRIPPGH